MAMRRFAVATLLSVLVLLVLATPLNEASSTGKPNSAVGCGTCHGSANSGVTPTHNFPAMYTPGQTYTITIGVNGGVSGNGGGFSLEATQGSFANPGAFAQVSQGSVTHSSADARTWTVDWTAPGSGSGQVTIRLAVNTVDKGGTSAGDAWNTMQSIIQEDIPPNQPPSATDVTITPNGDVAYNEDLLLTYTYQDPDNDQESNSIIRWSLNGSHVSSMDGKTTIMAADTTIGDVWTVSVTPRDSQGNLGSEVQSATTATIVDIDSDNDGVFDSEDEFPNDPNETVDSDDDGVGDNGDAFPDDPNEQLDSDEDGVGDNADEFPNDANETVDSDDDGVGDNGDAFPDDPTEQFDSDLDGVGDNADAFPNDENEQVDSDDDGVGDNADEFPDDASEQFDSDQDDVGDNADAFPNDANETMDSDEDGVGDNADVFPYDANETLDSDEDGVGDNADAFPNDANETLDSDEDGVGDNTDAFPNDANETVDTDMDGVGDNGDAFPTDNTETLDSDNDGVGDNADAFPNDAAETVDSDNDGVGDNADVFPTDPSESMDTDNDGVGDNADAFPSDATETSDSDGDGVGDNAQKIAEDKAAAAQKEADQQQMYMIIGGVVVLVLVALVFVIKRKTTEEIDLSDIGGMATNESSALPSVEAKTQLSNDAFSSFAPAQPEITQPTPVTPAEPSVEQQWTDESGYTWRKMSDGTTMWWNGTDWQRV